MTLEIISKHNSHYKELIDISKGKSDYLFVEGKKLFQELVKSPLQISKVYIDKKNGSLIKNSTLEIIYMSNSLIAQAFTTESRPNGEDLIIAFAKKPRWHLVDLLKTKSNLILLEKIQDPGNLGTILRSALAFNAGGVLITNDSIDPFNTKVIRASAGAIFNIPIVRLDENLNNFKLLAKKENYSIIATSPKGDKDVKELSKINKPKVFLFGNEGTGLSSKLLGIADKVISIPHLNKVESLNLGVAVSIVLWEGFYQ